MSDLTQSELAQATWVGKTNTWAENADRDEVLQTLVDCRRCCENVCDQLSEWVKSEITPDLVAPFIHFLDVAVLAASEANSLALAVRSFGKLSYADSIDVTQIELCIRHLQETLTKPAFDEYRLLRQKRLPAFRAMRPDLRSVEFIKNMLNGPAANPAIAAVPMEEGDRSALLQNSIKQH